MACSIILESLFRQDNGTTTCLTDSNLKVLGTSCGPLACVGDTVALSFRGSETGTTSADRAYKGPRSKRAQYEQANTYTSLLSSIRAQAESLVNAEKSNTYAAAHRTARAYT